MKPCLEFEGKNVDYAIEKACEELQLTTWVQRNFRIGWS